MDQCLPRGDRRSHRPGLRTRAELQALLAELLDPLKARLVPDGGGYHLGGSGVRYSQRVAAIEAWSRALWGIGPLLAGGGSWDGLADHRACLLRGTDPAHPAYWGAPTWADQIHVEMASLAVAICLDPDDFWHSLPAAERARVADWLSCIMKAPLPDNNWHFFRIMVGMALDAVGVAVDREALAYSFKVIEDCWKGGGWYIDGVDENYDWYNPFGFHYYGLVFAARCRDHRDELFRSHAARYLERAERFAAELLPLVLEDGPVVPWGRSLTYRFGVAGFFSACAFAGLEIPALDLGMGELKGLILRNLRWWLGTGMRDEARLLSVGYAYPNLVMAEQYNSPASPYWALKTFLVLALPASHPFWAAEEAPLPPQGAVSVLETPGYLVRRDGFDAVMLNPGYYPGREMVQAAAKYAKFAYSARAGFCVAHGSFGLEKTGCDSMLVLSEGDGYWRERRHTERRETGDIWARGRWRPWRDVSVTTTLVALGGWHLAVHLVDSARDLEAVEGGFSLPVFKGLEPCPWPRDTLTDVPAGARVSQAWCESIIEDVSPGTFESVAIDLQASHYWSGPRAPRIIHMEPNLNILHPLVMVPALSCRLPAGRSVLAALVRYRCEGAPELPAPQLAWRCGDSLEVGVETESGGFAWVGVAFA